MCSSDLALVRDCLAGDRVMALVQLQPGWVEDALARPPMQEMACAGTIVAHEQLSDGKFNIVLQGLVRVRILAELPPQKQYREVLGQVVEDGPYRGDGEAALRQAILEVCHRLPSEAAEGLLQLAAQNNGGALADVLGAALVLEPERRQHILEEQSIARRLEMVLGEVGALMAKLAPPNSSMPS